MKKIIGFIFVIVSVPCLYLGFVWFTNLFGPGAPVNELVEEGYASQAAWMNSMLVYSVVSLVLGFGLFFVGMRLLEKPIFPGSFSEGVRNASVTALVTIASIAIIVILFAINAWGHMQGIW